ncbi:MAG: hypothetical protein SFY69_06845 [Planctomycetota bacterium]|nr:hypothetical protein [Planctomycetota bacterium]
MPLVNLLVAAILTVQPGAQPRTDEPPLPDGPCVAPTNPPAPDAPRAVPPASDAPFASAGDMLNALEKADAELRTLTADLKFEREFEIQGDRQVRVGKLFYKDFTPEGNVTPDAAPAPRDRRFAVRFESLQVGSRLIPEVYEVLFDGQWLIEKRPANKELTRTQIVRAGDTFDPLRIGQGPFPLPVGQKRAEIEARYDVTLLAPDDGLEALDAKDTPALRAFVAGSQQLRLVVKPALAATEDLREIRLWYRRGDDAMLLPRLARTVNRAGDIGLVQMINVRVNTPIAPESLDTAAPADWNQQVRTLPPSSAGKE